MTNIVISSTGYFVPEHTISNEELVATYNTYVDQYNTQHLLDIQKGNLEKLQVSDAAFILKASGIKTRRVIDKSGILNPDIMHPLIAERSPEKLSIQCEIALHAAKNALTNAKKSAQEIDAIIVGSSNLQRPYPAIAIELQGALGASGFAFDMNAACSSATFGINMARSLILSNSAKCVLVVNPEIFTPNLNFRDRKSHFIFGDGSSAAIIEQENTCTTSHPFKILSGKMQTLFSSNIRNNFGYLARCEQSNYTTPDRLFTQNGKNVQEEVVPLASKHILDHVAELKINPATIKRLWLHQANINMNKAIAQNVLSRTASEQELPMVLPEYGNTGSSGVIITFNKHHEDLHSGDYGVICSFGAGYSVGSLILERL